MDSSKSVDICWQNLFYPRSIAAIGASNTTSAWGFTVTRQLSRSSYYKVHMVNPRETIVQGQPAFKSVLDIPGNVDLALILVPTGQVIRVLEECSQKGIKTAILITAGFAETGDPGGIKLQNKVAEAALKNGITFVGPNCMGIGNSEINLSTVPSINNLKILPGPVSLLSQSGSYSIQVIRALAERNIGMCKFVSTGNEAVLRLEDYLEFLANDPGTSIIVLYIEGLREGRRFMRLARQITRVKPIIALKVGGTETSAKAVLSHTAVLAGADAAYMAAFRQTGVIRAQETQEICDIAYTIHTQGLPRSNRVAILSLGGGPGAISAEACEREGLVIGQLAPETVKKLNKLLPSRWSHGNPVDTAGTMGGAGSLQALQFLLDDPGIDNLILHVNLGLTLRRSYQTEQETQDFLNQQKQIVNSVMQRACSLGKLIMFVPTLEDPETIALITRYGIPFYHSTVSVARTLRRLVGYRNYLDNMPC